VFNDTSDKKNVRRRMKIGLKILHEWFQVNNNNNNNNNNKCNSKNT